MTPEERERQIREIAQRLAERLAAEWPEGDLTINDIEALGLELHKASSSPNHSTGT